MPIKLSVKPIEETFKLMEADPTGETFVTIRQATTGDSIKLSNLFSDQTQIWDDPTGGTVKIQKKWNLEELKRYRASLTVIDCNIENEDGTLWFPFVEGKTILQGQFFKAWDSLPPEIADEIYECVQRINPEWNPYAEGE